MERKPLRQITAPLIVGLTYYLGARLGTSLSFEPDYIAALWPPNAVVLAALLLAPRRHWWRYLVVMIPAEMAADLAMGLSWPVALGFAGANIVEVTIAASGLRFFTRELPRFNNLRDVILFMIYAVFLAPAASATIAAGIAYLGIPETAYPVAWYRWFLGDALTHLTLTPAILLWLTQEKSKIITQPLSRLAEAGVLLLGLLITIYFTFSHRVEDFHNLPLLLNIPFVLLLWAAVRFGSVGASTANFLLVVISIWYTRNGQGPFTTLALAENIISLQAFLALRTTSTLLLATLLEERQQVQTRLRQAHEELEIKVRERTKALDQANQELDRQIQRLKTLFSVLPVGVSIVNENRQIVEMNATLEKILDISKAELLAGRYKNRRYIKSDGASIPLEEFPSARALAEKQAVHDVEMGIIKEDDSLIWTNVSAAPLPAPEQGVVVITQDITKRKQAEEALQLSETRFRTLVNSMNDIVYMLNTEQRHIGVFGNSIQEAGLSEEHFIGKTARDIFGAAAGAVHEAANQSALNGEKIIYEWSARQPGEVKFYQTSLSPLRASNGEIIGIVGVGRDITERKQAQVELHQKNIALQEVNRLLEEKNGQLQKALDNIKTLKGLLPICANCKRIRDDQGYWHDVVAYIRDHSEAEFTHGICKTCMKELYPEYYKDEPPEI